MIVSRGVYQTVLLSSLSCFLLAIVWKNRSPLPKHKALVVEKSGMFFTYQNLYLLQKIHLQMA